MKKKIALILAIITEIIIVFFEKSLSNSFSVDRFLILSLISFFFYAHFIFNIKNMYNFIYKRRYLLGLIFLITVTIFCFHGSSISVWNNIIQPNHNINDGGLILGIPRLIRGDEYLVSTPMIFSQVSNHFSATSNVLMGHSSLVTMYPSLPCFNISLLSNIFNIAYLILPISNAFAFCWYGKLLLIFFATFELSMLVTKGKRLYALLGAMLVTLSPACSWWSVMPILGYGALAIVILNLFLKEKRLLFKIIYTLLFSIIGISYIMLLYPAWQVPFGYVYLCFVIWVLYENKKELNKSQFIYLIISIVIIAMFVYLIFKQSYSIYLITAATVYPGNRFTTGGYGSHYLLDYMINIFFPCIPFYNPCEFSNFIGLYPIPLIVTFLSTIKSKKRDILSIALLIVGVFLSLWNYIELPKGIVKLTLLSFSIPERTYIVVGYICTFLIVRNMSLNEKDKTSKKSKILSTILSIIIVVSITLILKENFKEFINIYMFIIMNIVFIPIVYMLLLNDKKTNKKLSICLIILSLFAGGTVNPISKGTNVLTEKPFAKEVQKIVKGDKNGKWITVSSNYAIANYLVANGASTINSTNYYPNLSLWHTLDKEKKYENVYNRYAHILIELTNEDTNFELITQDTIKLNINIEDIDILKIDYIVSQEKIDILKSSTMTFDNIYADDGIYIYKLRRSK